MLNWTELKLRCVHCYEYRALKPRPTPYSHVSCCITDQKTLWPCFCCMDEEEGKSQEISRFKSTDWLLQAGRPTIRARIPSSFRLSLLARNCWGKGRYSNRKGQGGQLLSFRWITLQEWHYVARDTYTPTMRNKTEGLYVQRGCFMLSWWVVGHFRGAICMAFIYVITGPTEGFLSRLPTAVRSWAGGPCWLGLRILVTFPFQSWLALVTAPCLGRYYMLTVHDGSAPLRPDWPRTSRVPWPCSRICQPNVKLEVQSDWTSLCPLHTPVHHPL